MSLFFNMNESGRIETIKGKWATDEYRIPAGTPISANGEIANNGNAVGILVSEARLRRTYPLSIAPAIEVKSPKGRFDYEYRVITAGFVNKTEAEKEFGEAYTSEAKSAMKNINFVDETNPNSLGGSGGGAKSWNDLEDRPFYEDVTVIGDTINYDGYATDVAGSLMGGNLPMSRVSADAPTAKELIGGVIALTSGGEVMEFVIAEGNIFDYGSYAVIGGIQDLGQPDLPAVAIAYADGINSTETIDAVLPQKGTYLLSAVSYGICTSKFYVPNFTFTAGVLKRIDKKFMPPIPTFNLEAMGIGTVSKGNILEIEADTSALLAALEEGSVWVSFAYSDSDYIMNSLVSATKNISQGYTFFYVPVTMVPEPFIAEFVVTQNMLGVKTYDLTPSASATTT